MTVLFGYTHVSETSCGACGANYMMLESVPEGYRMRCWCGASCRVEFDDDKERDEFISKYKEADS